MSASTTTPTAVDQSCLPTSSMVTLATTKSITRGDRFDQITLTRKEAVFPSRPSRVQVKRLVVVEVALLVPLKEDSSKTLTITLNSPVTSANSRRIIRIRTKSPNSISPKCTTNSHTNHHLSSHLSNSLNRAVVGLAEELQSVVVGKFLSLTLTLGVQPGRIDKTVCKETINEPAYPHILEDPPDLTK